MPIKFLVLGEGIWGFFGGGSAEFIFMGARIFLTLRLFLKARKIPFKTRFRITF